MTSVSVPPGAEPYIVARRWEPPRAATKPAEAPAYLPMIVASQLAGEPVPERAWLVEGLIPGGTVTLLNGDGGVGKSLVSLQLEVATALGRPWFGRAVQGGPCLFLTAEDDVDEVHRRLVDITAEEGVGLADLVDLSISSLAGEDALLAVSNGHSNIIKPTALFRAPEEKIRTDRPALVVLDTLADLFGGEENQRAQARQFIGMLRGLAIHCGTTVLLLAHPSLSGMASGSGTSGSTAWNNSVRSRLYFERVKAEDGSEDDPDLRALKTMKSNYARTGEEIRMRWRSGVFVIEGKVGGSFAQVAALAKAERVFVDLLVSYEAEGRYVSATPSANYAPFVFAKDIRAEGVNKATLTAAMNSLFDAKRICVVDYGPASKCRKRITLASNGGDA